MKTVLKIGSFFGLLILVFLAGRFSAPNTKQLSTIDDDLNSAWNNYIQAQQNIRDYLVSQPYFGKDDQASAEAYRLILYSLPAAIELALHDPQFPRFTRIADDDAKSGMENPDNEYRMAIVDGNLTYKITGQIRSGRRLYLQSVIGQPGIGDAGPGTFAGSLGPDDIDFAPDGSFEIIASAAEPEKELAWLRLAPGVETILVRLTDPDWQTSTEGDWLRIERLCPLECPSHPDPLSHADAVRLLNETAESMHDRTVSWVAIANRIWAHIDENGFGDPRRTPNGLEGQYSAWGTFKLADNEALIFSVAASNADYQGIQLASRWFISLDYRNRQSSLTREQALVSEDDHLKFVISHEDPGVHNWLDPESHSEGLIMLRWQGIKAQPQRPYDIQKVPFDSIKDFFAESEMISPEQRQETLKLRAKQIDHRFQ